jgi:hypothetical protein
VDDQPSGLPNEVQTWLDARFHKIESRAFTRNIVKRGNANFNLFHYTNAEALRCILTSKALWATHFRSLNDASEFSHGKEIVDVLMAAAVGAASGGERGFLERARPLLEAASNDEKLEPYVVSFCRDNGNRLSQWRAYGDGGAGFAIGFGYRRLRKHFGSVRVLPCVYDERLQQKILSQTVEEYGRAVQAAVSKWPALANPIEGFCRCNFISLLLAYFALFKHPGFEEEREWRLVARLYDRALIRKFRTGRFGIIPYIELTSPRGNNLPIAKICQGPTADPVSAKYSLDMILRDRKYAGVKVDVSKIPFRG